MPHNPTSKSYYLIISNNDIILGDSDLVDNASIDYRNFDTPSQNLPTLLLTKFGHKIWKIGINYNKILRSTY